MRYYLIQHEKIRGLRTFNTRYSTIISDHIKSYELIKPSNTDYTSNPKFEDSFISNYFIKEGEPTSYKILSTEDSFDIKKLQSELVMSNMKAILIKEIIFNDEYKIKMLEHKIGLINKNDKSKTIAKTRIKANGRNYYIKYHYNGRFELTKDLVNSIELFKMECLIELKELTGNDYE